MTQKLYKYLGQPTQRGLKYIKDSNTSKLWPRIKTKKWPSYGVMTMFNIIGTGRFRKNVTNYDRLQIQKAD